MDITMKPYDAETQTLTVIMYLTELADGKMYKNVKVMKSTLEGYMKAMAGYCRTRYMTRARS